MNEANTTTQPQPPSGGRVSEKRVELESSSELDSEEPVLELKIKNKKILKKNDNDFWLFMRVKRVPDSKSETEKTSKSSIVLYFFVKLKIRPFLGFATKMC